MCATGDGAADQRRQVFAWRMRRQLLEPRAGVSGRGARGGSAACRRRSPRRRSSRSRCGARVAEGGGRRALAKRRLVKTWAMRGTLHVLDPAQAPAFLALMAAARSWERPRWVKASRRDARRDGGARARPWRSSSTARSSRARSSSRGSWRASASARLGEPLRSGLGTLLKPFAWQGLLCFGPARATG